MIEGIVMSRNVKLWNIVIDNETIINLSCLVLQKHFQGLPEIGQFVRIGDHFHKSYDNPRHVFLCNKSILECDDLFPSAQDFCLPHALKKYNLGVRDILNVNRNLKLVEDYIGSFIKLSAEYIVISIMGNLAESCNSEVEEMDICSRMVLPVYSLESISDCQYVDNTNEKYSEFPYWSFGVHHKKLHSKVLIGFFYISERYGLPFIKDAKYQIPCCVIVQSNKDLSKITNKIVLIKDYQIFTEIFKEKDVYPMEYMLFKIKDVCVISEPSFITKTTDVTVHNRFYADNIKMKINAKYKFKFLLLRKSTTVWSDRKESECWLQILVLKNNRCASAFLALNKNYVHIVPLLDVNGIYEVHHNAKLSTCNWNEIQRSEKQEIPSYLLKEESAVFICSSLTDEECSILPQKYMQVPTLSVEGVLEYIKTSSDLISFQGLVHAKEFVKPIESRTMSSSTSAKFGTSGSKTHVLHFINPINHDTKLMLFINNWESLLVPLGLLPNMRLMIRNVLPQSKRYLKSSVLTTFTVLGYEPPVNFTTMCLSSEFYGCGKLCYLGYGDLLPKTVLIKARVLRIYIQYIKITHNRCKICQCVETCECPLPELEANVTLKFYIKDQEGDALVISKSLQVLQAILGLNEYHWNIFIKALHLLPYFKYTSEQYIEVISDLNDSEELLHRALQTQIAMARWVCLGKLELYCRKMETNLDDDCDTPMWFCLHAKLEID